jgi:hypothetical protein
MFQVLSWAFARSPGGAEFRVGPVGLFLRLGLVLPLVPALPAPEYYGGSAPPGPFSGRRAYPRTRTGCPHARGTGTRRFPCSP